MGCDKLAIAKVIDEPVTDARTPWKTLGSHGFGSCNLGCAYSHSS
jgi:hypothetical protein